MRNLYDSQDLVVQIERILGSSLDTKFSTEVLSRITPSALTQNFENSYRIVDNSQTNLLVLSILSWYVPEDLGVLLRLNILEKIEFSELGFLELCCRSKGQMLCFLLETSNWSTRDFFGNILTPRMIKQALLSLKPIFKSRRKPKRVQRHRGYRDKGTLRKNSDKHDLWISTDEQLKLEEERLSTKDTLAFLAGWVT